MRLPRFVPLLILVPSVVSAQAVQVVHAFDTPPRHPLGGLVQGTDGSLYGTTSYGGPGGTIYRVTAAGQVTVVHRFADGQYPRSRLFRGSDGALYGTTLLGGSANRGTVFRFDPAAPTLTTLHAFTTEAAGYHPSGGLMQASDGMLYGVTERGGPSAGGVIYRVNPVTNAAVTLHAFSPFGPTGDQPVAGLTEAANGFLYGPARNSTGFGGLIYRLDRATGAVATVHEFSRDTAYDPTSALTRSSDGFLYGTTLHGGAEDAGTIYRLDPATGAVQIVYELRPSNGLDGRAPFTSLVEAPDGHLYGTTLSGLTGDGGTVYRLARLPDGVFTFTTLRVFDRLTAGAGLLGDLALTSDGLLYGVTESGGPGTGGTIFRFDPQGRGPAPDPLAFTVVHAFTVLDVSWAPTTPPVAAPDGFLYGTTSTGGAGGRGEVYRLDPATGGLTRSGAMPGPPLTAYQSAANSGLVAGGDGFLDGTSSYYSPTPFSPTPGESRIIRMDPATGVATTALVPPPTPDQGPFTLGGLVRAPNGGLYGIQRGSLISRIYRFHPRTSTMSVVADLPMSTSLSTISELELASDGRLYGSRLDVALIRFIVRSNPSIFSVDPGTDSHQAFAPLAGTDIGKPVSAGSVLYVTFRALTSPSQQILAIQPATGATEPVYTLPVGERIDYLTAAPDGTLYGFIHSSVSTTLVRFDPSTRELARLHTFSEVEGRPTAPLVASPDGLLYGVTNNGVAGGGLVFRVSAAGTPPALDTDNDGLANSWEITFGLNPSSAADGDGAPADPDGDGRTNLEESAAGTHPRGFVTRYMAEGVTNAFFRTRYALLNPGMQEATVLARFLTDEGRVVPHRLIVPPLSRRTIDGETLPGLAGASFSMVLESDALVTLDRTMSWDGSGYGSHAETALGAPAQTWYLAEGSTSGDFTLFYLLQNPHSTPTAATVRYLRPSGAPITRTYTLGPNSRTTIAVDEQQGVESTDVSAVITASAPIIAERAMYWNRPGQPFVAGHGSAGVTAPALEWFLAEGATGPFFDLFVLVANPNDVPAEITVDYLLLGGGILTKAYTVAANSRFTIWVDDEELPAGSGQKLLANVAVSTTVRSTNQTPIIVERAMWWPGPETSADYWYEAHNSPGATTTATRWAMAEGEVGGAGQTETYVLIANPGASSGRALVSLRFEDGSALWNVYDVAPHSRTNVPIGSDFPTAADRRFGIVVESMGLAPVPLVVERAMYTSVGGVLWSAGTNALATPIP